MTQTLSSHFKGFPRECLEFYASLEENNNKTWFDAHRQEYERFVMEPARRFVAAMGERLKLLVPELHADPRTNRSIFRIYRDTRFSRDKTPYKRHLAVFFWEGDGPRMECSGFYFHFDTRLLILGVGLYRFPKETLTEYRRSVLDEDLGERLALALAEAQEAGEYSLGGRHYKRVPRGLPGNHPRADLLRHNGLHLGRTEPLPDALFHGGLVEHCAVVFEDLLPVHRWLVDLVARSRA
jgi:uncharacterized protein (TIGR02453 family)